MGFFEEKLKNFSQLFWKIFLQFHLSKFALDFVFICKNKFPAIFQIPNYPPDLKLTNMHNRSLHFSPRDKGTVHKSDRLTKLYAVIKTKRPGLLTKSVILMLDNTCPHTTNLSQWLLKDFKLKIFEHSPYSQSSSFWFSWIFTAENWIREGSIFY